MGKRVQNPRPIVFGIRVLTETLSQWDCEAKAWSSLLRYPTDGHRDSKWNRKSFDGKWICRIVLAIRQSLRVENPVAAGAIEIAAENDGAQFKRAFLVA